jgi:predicted methyltransferase
MKKLTQKTNKVTSVPTYSDTFLKSTECTACNGKSVYITSAFHEKISRVVFMLTERKVSIFDYLNNVLKQHFEDYGEEIRAKYDEMAKPIL